MPFKTVEGTRKRVSSLKNLTDKQVKTFISVFNKLEKDGTDESSAIAQSISAAKKVDKSMTIDIDKATNNDKRSILHDNLQTKFSDQSVWVMDFDDDFVFFESCEERVCRNFRLSYEFDGTSATFGDEPEEVVRTTEFKVIESSHLEKSILARVTDYLDKHFSGTKKTPHQIIKQFDEEEMIAIEPLYIAPGEVDGHGDTMELEDIHYMVDSLNKAIDEGRLQSGLFHAHSSNAFAVEKAWVNEVACQIGETMIPEGQPIVKVRFSNSTAYELRKKGTLQGLSIGAQAKEIVGLDE